MFANPEPGGSHEGAGSPARYAEPATIVMPGLPVAPPGGGPAADPAPPSPQPGPPAARRRRWYSPALVLLALALLPVAAATTDLDALDGWGLAKVLSPAAWAALACAVGACLAELWMPRPRVPMLATATGVLVLCSTGLPSVVEPVARFTTSYVIVGFVDAIAGDGVPPPDIDARFFWPAFFAQWAWFRDAAGAADLDVVLRWFPPVVVLVWATGVYALARSMLGGTRAPWAAAWLFVGLNWIEQDYFSPQAIGIVLLLTVLTFALGPLATRRTDAAGVPGWPAPHPGAPRLRLLRRWAVAAMTPPNRPTLPPRQLLLIYFCAALCLIALAPEHQLTPFAIIGQLTLLAVVGRFRGRGLVLVAIFAVVVYVIIGARDFWMSQIGLLLGSGDDGNALQTGIADRLAGDVGQVAVKLLRIAVPGLTWLLAIAGAWVYWRRRRDLVPIFLAAVPMAFAAVQSYGGELFLRIVLYGLPVLTILGADALRSYVRRGGRRPGEAAGRRDAGAVPGAGAHPRGQRGLHGRHPGGHHDDAGGVRRDPAGQQDRAARRHRPVRDAGRRRLRARGRDRHLQGQREEGRLGLHPLPPGRRTGRPAGLHVDGEEGRRAGQPPAGVVAAGRRRARRVGGVPHPVPERVQRGAGQDRADGGQRAADGGRRWQLSRWSPAVRRGPA